MCAFTQLFSHSIMRNCFLMILFLCKGCVYFVVKTARLMFDSENIVLIKKYLLDRRGVQHSFFLLFGAFFRYRHQAKFLLRNRHSFLWNWKKFWSLWLKKKTNVWGWQITFVCSSFFHDSQHFILPLSDWIKRALRFPRKWHSENYFEWSIFDFCKQVKKLFKLHSPNHPRLPLNSRHTYTTLILSVLLNEQQISPK